MLCQQWHWDSISRLCKALAPCPVVRPTIDLSWEMEAPCSSIPQGSIWTVPKIWTRPHCRKSTWGTERGGERRAQGRVWRPGAEEDDSLWLTPTIMDVEKWGYLLSIPNDANHQVYICLCMCVYTMVNVRLKASSEGQRKLIKVLSLPIFNVHMAVVFPASLICNFTELPQMRNLNPLKHVT